MPSIGLAWQLIHGSCLQLANLTVARLAILAKGDLITYHARSPTMPENKKQYLFYNRDHLSQINGDNKTVTLFSALDTPLAQRSDETLLTAVNSQALIVESSHRDCIQSLSYSAYGHSHIYNVLGYTGQRCDRFTYHYLLGNGYRAYSAILMRFLSPDTLSPFGNGGRNAYAYCEGDPTNNVDPSGHMFGNLRRLVNRGSDAPSSSFTAKNKYYNAAKEVTESTPPLAEFKNWFDSIYTRKKHLKQAAKLHQLAEGLETWSPNPDLVIILNEEDQWYHAFGIYQKALNKTVAMIEKVYIPVEPVTISPLPSLSSLNSDMRKAHHVSSLR